MNALAIINIAKTQLGLEESDYRSLLVRVTGKDSLRAMNEPQRMAVIKEMERLGFKVKPGPKSGGKSLPLSTKPYIRMIHALWKSCAQKGVISDGSRQALRTFVRKNSPKQDPDFLTYAEASPIIEALKKMERRGKC